MMRSKSSWSQPFTARTALGRQPKLVPYLFILPAFLIYASFFLWPILQLVLLTLQDWDGIGEKRFVGIENYRELFFSDPAFWAAFIHNLVWMLAALIVPVSIGLFLAILLARGAMRGRAIFRTIYFVPQVISSVVVAVIWRWIYNPSFGALNQFLAALGLSSFQRGWLGDADLALPALFIAWSWVQYGFAMVIFLAALQNIDEVYFDAAKVDGANWWQQFRHVLLPAIRRPLTIVLLIISISSFQVFDLVFITTRGGPGNATMNLAVYMYQTTFAFNRVGYGATVAMTLGAVILTFSVLFLFVRGALNEENS